MTPGAVVPTFTIVATVLASTRNYAWTSAQLSILDIAIDSMCDDLAEANPRFNAELFRKTARYRYGYNA